MVTIAEPTASQMPLVRSLFLEYAASLDFDLGFQGFSGELAALPGEYEAPLGCLRLAFRGAETAGCAALRPLEGRIAEMKRLYVRPGCQGEGIGRALTVAVIQWAKQNSYEKIRLDTVPAMQAAGRLYRSLGFAPIPPYRENPIAGAIYLEKAL